MRGLLKSSLVLVGLGATLSATLPFSSNEAVAATRKATTARGQVRVELRGRELTIVLTRRASRSTRYAFHHGRLRYGCYVSLWASLGQESTPGSGVARGLTTRPFRRGRERMTIRLDADISDRAGGCVVESVRSQARIDVARVLFVTGPEFVRTDAPGPPELEPRPGERRLEELDGGAALFLSSRSLRVVLDDDARLAVQRDFRTQALNVFCSPGRNAFTGVSVIRRFPRRSRELVALFDRPLGEPARVTCGVETQETGTEAFGTLPRLEP